MPFFFFGRQCFIEFLNTPSFLMFLNKFCILLQILHCNKPVRKTSLSDNIFQTTSQSSQKVWFTLLINLELSNFPKNFQ